MAFVERLQDIRNAFEKGDTPREIVETLSANIARLLTENVAQNAIAVGETASIEFSVNDQNGPMKLVELANKDFLVLTWFRGNW